MPRDDAGGIAWIDNHLDMVEKIAKLYRDQGFELEELIQVGRRGLVEAARRYDPGKGIRFSTVASWYIRKFMRDRIKGYASPEPGGSLRWFGDMSDEPKN